MDSLVTIDCISEQEIITINIDVPPIFIDTCAISLPTNQEVIVDFKGEESSTTNIEIVLKVSNRIKATSKNAGESNATIKDCFFLGLDLSAE